MSWAGNFAVQYSGPRATVDALAELAFEPLSGNCRRRAAEVTTMLPYHIIDAFTHEPFGGNPAAVVLVSTFPADVRMQCIAR